MAESVIDLEWGDPVIPLVENTKWKAEVKKRLGYIPDALIRVSESQWLRETFLNILLVKVKEFPSHLSDIGGLVISQENACRFCYGVARAQMKVFGYSDKMIAGIEQDMLMSELDQKDRAFISFCRSLARSNPRPTKAERDNLLDVGFSRLEVSEIALYIAKYCFTNRVATFISSPPMYEFERLSDSLLGRLLRPLIARKLRLKVWSSDKPIDEYHGPFSNVIKGLDGIPAAVIFREGLEGAFSSNVLSNELKIMMFGVVARSLGCSFCQKTTKKMAMDLGFSEEEFENSLSTLASSRINAQEQKILVWTRETVQYKTESMQKFLNALAMDVEANVLLEAIGVAALANSIVRLGVLLE